MARAEAGLLVTRIAGVEAIPAGVQVRKPGGLKPEVGQDIAGCCWRRRVTRAGGDGRAEARFPGEGAVRRDPCRMA